MDKDGSQWYYGTTFFAVGEHVLNEEPLSSLPECASQMVAKLLAPEKAYALGTNESKAYVLSFGSNQLSLYVRSNFTDTKYDVSNNKCTLVAEEEVRLSGKYDASYDIGTYKNYCFNPSVPIRIQVGVCRFDLYISIGINLVGAAAISYDHYEQHTYEIDLSTGKVKEVGSGAREDSPSIANEISGEVKLFVTSLLYIGAIPSLSFDICPIALSVGTVTTSTGCIDLAIYWSGYIQTPSIYDTSSSGTASLKPGSVQFYSLEGLILGTINAKYSCKFISRKIGSIHLEEDAWVAYCTKKRL